MAVRVAAVAAVRLGRGDRGPFVPLAGERRPRYADHRAITGAATTVATTVVVMTLDRSRSRRAAWSLGSIGKPARSNRGVADRFFWCFWAWIMAT